MGTCENEIEYESKPVDNVNRDKQFEGIGVMAKNSFYEVRVLSLILISHSKGHSL